jgi:hypothetical protein
MPLDIRKSTKIEAIQEAFKAAFPYLKIEFLQSPMKQAAVRGQGNDMML